MPLRKGEIVEVRAHTRLIVTYWIPLTHAPTHHPPPTTHPHTTHHTPHTTRHTPSRLSTTRFGELFHQLSSKSSITNRWAILHFLFQVGRDHPDPRIRTANAATNGGLVADSVVLTWALIWTVC